MRTVTPSAIKRDVISEKIPQFSPLQHLLRYLKVLNTPIFFRNNFANEVELRQVRETAPTASKSLTFLVDLVIVSNQKI